MWTANLFKVTTGQIGPQLHIEDATWSISLNEIESLNIHLRKSDLPDVDLNYWLSPWWAGVVLMWDNIPVVAGPIITRPSESFGYVYLDVTGIRQVLAHRFVTRELNDWTELATSTVAWKGLSLGTIAKKAVQLSTSPKRGGALPISYPIADKTAIDNDDHQRTYHGYNISNISTHDVLTKLSEVSNGPDIMFRPRLVRADQLTFDMLYGDEADPRIDQKITPIWDTTAEKSAVTDMDIVHTGTYQTNRVYTSGAGSDEGTLIRVVEDQGPLQEGYPLLETAISISDSENASVVIAHGRGELEANTEGLTEIQITVHAGNDEANNIGSFWSGDLAHVIVDDSWLSLKEGMHRMRILNINGRLSSDVKMSLQTED